MMGVPNMEPNTPPLLMVNVPPSMSSTASSFLRACKGKKKKRQPVHFLTSHRCDERLVIVRD